MKTPETGDRIELRAGPKRRKQVFHAPDEHWLIAHDITLVRVEERVLRFWQTHDATPDVDYKFRRDMKALWPDPWPDRTLEFANLQDAEFRADARDIFEDKVRKRRRGPPTGHDISDYEGNLALWPFTWLKALTPDEVKLIRWIARGFGPSYLARRWKMSKQYVSRLYRDAIVRAWHAAILEAMGKSPPGLAEPSSARTTEVGGVTMTLEG